MSVEWKISDGLVEYPDALRAMEDRVAAIRAGEVDEQVWLLEHPSLYTAGTSAKATDLLKPDFPVFETGRGGQYTYHGPGQRVGYVMLNLKERASRCISRESGNLDGVVLEDPCLRRESTDTVRRQPDIKQYIYNLEQWIINALEVFDIKGERRAGRVGIWVVKPDGGEAKIAAIGVRIRHWVSYHGIAINLNPDLSHFGGIIPCGIADHGVTSFADLGVNATMDDLDKALQEQWDVVFG